MIIIPQWGISHHSWVFLVEAIKSEINKPILSTMNDGENGKNASKNKMIDLNQDLNIDNESNSEQQ